jgi:hypothetical protein
MLMLPNLYIATSLSDDTEFCGVVFNIIPEIPGSKSDMALWRSH